MIDADMGAFGVVRVMVNLNQLGEAAGVAGYILAIDGGNVQSLNTDKLRFLLKSGGSCII